MRDLVRSKRGGSRSRRLGFPRFKKRGRCRNSFRLTGTLCCGGARSPYPAGGDPDLRINPEAGPAAGGRHARILSSTVSRTAAGRGISPSKSTGAVPDRHPRPGSAIGIDLGVKSLPTGADDTGTVITVPGRNP